MRFLFIHPNFPSQHGPLAGALARAGHEVVFLTNVDRGEMPGVKRVVYQVSRQPGKETHHYVRNLESAVLHGQAAFRVAVDLKKAGFVPDVIFGHSGWGPTLFMRDLFPKSTILCNFEWYYQTKGSDVDFDPSEKMTVDDVARIRTRNASILLDLVSCEGGICPMNWQKAQFPREFHPKLQVIHEGIDTDYYQPSAGAKLVLPRVSLDLSGEAEIVTYVGRGMEPYRGFPQFIEAVDTLLRLRPKCHVVIVGEDRVAYGRQLPKGQSYKQRMLEKFPLDPARVHFTGLLSQSEYRAVLHASSAHVYLTRPFVLSWSMMEAMSAGCLLVASDTPPVTEVVEDGFNGLLVDFFQPLALAERLAGILANPGSFTPLRAKARETIVHKYAMRDIFPRRLEWFTRFLQ